jgi:hypothetical protein
MYNRRVTQRIYVVSKILLPFNICKEEEEILDSLLLANEGPHRRPLGGPFVAGEGNIVIPLCSGTVTIQAK